MFIISISFNILRWKSFSFRSPSSSSIILLLIFRTSGLSSTFPTMLLLTESKVFFILSNIIKKYIPLVILIGFMDKNKIILIAIKLWKEPNLTSLHLPLPSPCLSLSSSMILSQRTKPPSRPYARWFSCEGRLHRWALNEVQIFIISVLQWSCSACQFLHSVLDST